MTFGPGEAGQVMHVLALDSAAGSCSATVLAGNEVIATRRKLVDRGHAGLLPVQVTECMAECGITAANLGLVAVTVGPGSFTGIRSGVALAQGLALACGLEAVGVTVGEALAESLPHLGRRALWVATPSRRGRVFLEIGGGEVGGGCLSVAVDDLPTPPGPVAVAGSSAAEVASRLAARGFDVMLTDARHPLGRHIAAVALRRRSGSCPPLALEPLYVDAPEARPKSTIGNAAIP